LDRNVATDEKLTEHFSQYGAVSELDIKWDRGFGFVIFKSGSGVQLALWDHAKHYLDGKWFDVQPCLEKGGAKGDGKGKGEKGKGEKGKGDFGKGDFGKGKGYGKSSTVSSSYSASYVSSKGGKDKGKGMGTSPVGGLRPQVGKGGKDGAGGSSIVGGRLIPRQPNAPPLAGAGPPRSAPPERSLVREAAPASRSLTPGAPSSPAHWNSAAVLRFLRNKGLEELCPTFQQQEVTGPVLMSLTEADLESALGIKKFGVRRQLALAIQELRRGSTGGSSARPAASQASASYLRPNPSPAQLRPQNSSAPLRAPAQRSSSVVSGGYSSYSSSASKGAGKDAGKSSYAPPKGKGKGKDSWSGGKDSWSSGGKGGKDSWRSKPY